MPQIVQRRLARRDLLEAFEYLDEHAGIEVAGRFLSAALASFQELARMPEMGSPCDFESRALRRLRRWLVKGFNSWIIFYLPKREGIEIVRVLHGARDLGSLFE